MKVMLLLAVVVILIVGVFSSTEMTDAQTQVESNYRVPVIGTYNLVRTDAVCYSHIGSGRTGTRYMDISLAGPSSSDYGMPVYSSGVGTVVASGTVGGYGLHVRTENSEVGIIYAHLSKIYVSSGQNVARGQLLGFIGNTGNSQGDHLHWEAYPLNGSGFNIYNISGISLQSNAPFGSDPCPNPDPDGIDGTVSGNSLSGYNSCPEFYATGYAYVVLFDHPDCKGNMAALYADPGVANLTSRFNDRTRSIYIPPGKSLVISAYVDDPWSLHHCHTNDMWNLDTDFYDGTTTKIGWQGGDGSNMISRVQVLQNSTCQYDMGTITNNTGPEVQVSFYAMGPLPSEPIQSESYLPSWLLEFGTHNTSLFNIEIHTNVEAVAGTYDAHRVLVDNTIMFETSAPEYWHQWNTYGWAGGDHTIRVEYRRLSDGGNWSNALVHQGTVFLSADREGASPCTGEEGVELTSGNDCVRLTRSFRSLDPIGWGNRNQLSVRMIGQNEAWIYEGTDYEGTPHIVLSGQTRQLGNNLLSVAIRPITPTPVPPPQSAFTVDANTRYLFPLNEGSGSTVTDIASGLTGSIGPGNTWVSGQFGSAINFPYPGTAAGITTAPFEVCPMTVEFWMNRQNNDGRLVGQLGNGPLKWLIGLSQGRPKLEMWYPGASAWVISPYQVEVGAWHYVMATYDCDRTAKLYVDNRFAGELTLPAPMNTGPARFEIGAVEASQRCNCIIDDVRISNIVRLPNAQPPTTSLDFAIVDSVTGLVEVNATWSNAAEDWQVVNWGDGAEVGYFGGSGTSLGHTNGYQHYYQPGNYTMVFTVKGLDGQTYTSNQTVTIEQVQVPTFSLTATVTDPIHGLVETDATWSEAQENWQVLNWGDGTETGYFGSSGTNVGHENGYTHYYQSPGNYTLTFSVYGLDNTVYTTTQSVNIQSGVCTGTTHLGALENQTQLTLAPYAAVLVADAWNDPNLIDQGIEMVLIYSEDFHIIPAALKGDAWGFCSQQEARQDLAYNHQGKIHVLLTSSGYDYNAFNYVPEMSLDFNVLDPISGYVEVIATWSNAGDAWQLLNWGKNGEEVGYFGSSGTSVGHAHGNTNWYAPGTYTLTFTVTGLDGQPNVLTEQLVIDPLPVPAASLTLISIDPVTGYVETNATWSNGDNVWQILNWGDGTETGYWGSSGTNVGHEHGNAHYYAPGTYTLTFTAGGYGGQYTTATQTVEITGGESLMASPNGGDGEQLITEESSQTEEQQPAEPTTVPPTDVPPPTEVPVSETEATEES